uniref:GIY-YIG nuclease family protein n=1 Tax=candidate division WWE3 bacterium TaxID=2053526 RepID=A0A831YYU9_UNCKA
MYFVYVLKSLQFKTRYVGSTEDLNKRLKEHNSGKVRYTKGRKPWELIWKEAYKTKTEAIKRERFLKTGQGRKFLDRILS